MVYVTSNLGSVRVRFRLWIFLMSPTLNFQPFKDVTESLLHFLIHIMSTFVLQKQKEEKNPL